MKTTKSTRVAVRLLLGAMISAFAGQAQAASSPLTTDGFLGGIPLAGFALRFDAATPPSVTALMDSTVFGPGEEQAVASLAPDTSLLTAAIAPDRPDARRDGGTAGTARRQEGAFGSVLLPIAALPASRHFKRVAKTLTSCDGGFGCKPAMKLLDTIASDVEGLPFLGRLERVNQTVNTTIRYQPDIKNYRQRDHWAEVPEIVGRRKGDCEDYAILKMAALAYQGVPMTSMSIVVLFDHKNQAFHAVLAVATSAGTYILDNTRADIYLDTTQPHYQPLFSLAQGRAWIHGVRKTSVTASRTIDNLDAVAPGEGG